MRSTRALVPCVFRFMTLVVFLTSLVFSVAGMDVDKDRAAADENTAVSESMVAVKWNVNENDAPLLGFPEDRINSRMARSLNYKLGQFSFRIFQTLSYDEERRRFLLPTVAQSGANPHFIEFAVTSGHTYASTDGSNIRLVDNDAMKTIVAGDGAKYIFVRHPDGEFRCVLIKEASGATLNLLYAANGLILRGLRDATGRSVTLDYDEGGLKSITQTWMDHLQGFTRTWNANEPKPGDSKIEYSHTVSRKMLPPTAILRGYTSEMAASDKLLAQIFGGPNAIASGNGFEPAGLAMAYPLYRGDVMGDDGIKRRGHLSFAMHLYGRADGAGDSPLYVPAGFTQHSAQPTPTDAAVTFYYPILGNQSDVTLAVFHVADFQITSEGDRVRIGKLGGPGGSSPLYKHSHLEFYRGNTGLPASRARAKLRIDPAKVFSPARVGK